jgi:hypothetical protein
MEHGRPEGARLGRLAERLTPGWARLSGGCHLDRHPESYFDGLGVTPREEFRFWRGIGRCWVLVRDGSG